MRSVTSAATMLATLAIPSNKGMFPWSGKDAFYSFDENRRMSVCKDPYPIREASLNHRIDFVKKKSPETSVEHRSLVTACILALRRAYGHDDGAIHSSSKSNKARNKPRY